MDVKRFLESYARAWETRDAKLASSLFHEDGLYHEDPFGEPIAGRAAIEAYWAGATKHQTDIDVLIREPVVAGTTLAAEWGARYLHTPTGERRELRGMLVAEFEGEQCRAFREYWHRRVTQKAA
jgi:uncharacterized protein (TIGR02246 family)